MTSIPGFSPAAPGAGPPSKLSDAASVSWVRNVVDVLNSVLRGKMNVVYSLTLEAGANSTTVIDARIGVFSSLHLQPLTTHAAAALYSAPYVLVTAQKDGQATFSHANDANADKTFNLTILG